MEVTDKIHEPDDIYRGEKTLLPTEKEAWYVPELVWKL
jgi:hypothetical protein